MKTGKSKTDPDAYGIGQVSVVYRNGKFHVWFNRMENGKLYQEAGNKKIPYTVKYHVAVDNITDLANLIHDDTGSIFPLNGKIDIVYHNEQDTAFSKSNHLEYNFIFRAASQWHFSDFGDVRWNADANRYEMWLPDRAQGYAMRIKKYHSTDGVIWDDDEEYNEANSNRYMDWIHNIGVSGDKYGHIHGDHYLLSFSGPSFYTEFTSEQFNAKYDMEHDEVSSGMWPMWELLNGTNWQTTSFNYNAENNFGESPSKRLQFFVGDFDGDGIDELGAVERLENGMLKWYLQSSKNPSNNRKSDIWGKKWSSTAVGGFADNQYKILTGDYDGDGKTDYGVVVYRNNNGWKAYWRIHSSKTNDEGVPSIPKGLIWNNVSPDYALPIGDFDGDGIVDQAAILPSSRAWNMFSSIDGGHIKMRRITGTDETCNDGPTEHETLPIIYESGIPSRNLTPVVADYDGDHITDLALLDPHGNLYIRSSQTGCHLKWSYNSIYSNKKTLMTFWPYKLSEDNALLGKYLAGDFDGDGVADFMVLNESTGYSEIHLSRGIHNIKNTFYFPTLRNLTSKEILVGDFDGNGHSDICIIDLNTNKYYIYFFEYDNKNEILKTKTQTNVTLKYVDFSSSYPNSLTKKAVKPAEPAKPEITQEKAMPNFNAYVQDQKLVVSNTLAGQKVVVFDLRGKEISRKVSNGVDMTFDIPNKGMYIVRSGNSFRKISIK